MKNILAVVAHPDDLEIMAGGAIIKFMKEGKHIHVLVLSDGIWVNPDGVRMRSREDVEQEIRAVVDYMKYDSYEILNEETLNLQFKDSLVCEVLRRISKYNIDTIICPWEKDTHRDHRIANEIATSASRRVPNFLVGQINYYIKESFTPNFYVDITDVWDKKLECVSQFASQWERSKDDWTDFMSITSRYNGEVMGCYRAEGFIAHKFLY